MVGTRLRGRWSRCFYIAMFSAIIIASSGEAHAAISVASSTTRSVNWDEDVTTSLTFAHSVSGTYRLLLVGVSLNISGSTGTTVSALTYNGTALTRIAQINQGTVRRVEIWQLLNPPVGTANVVLTLGTLTNHANVGVVATALSLIGVNQTTPLGTAATAANAGSTTASV